MKSIVDMMTSKEPHPRGGGGRARLELGYTPEQATLVTRIRSCHSNYEILNVSRHCSRYILKGQVIIMPLNIIIESAFSLPEMKLIKPTSSWPSSFTQIRTWHLAVRRRLRQSLELGKSC